MSLLIRNVKIAGRGPGVPERGDVFISGNKISAIGDLKGKRAAEVVDGQGAWLAPGFIDTETTADKHLSLFDPERGAAIAALGVTTVIGGHCGLTLSELQDRGVDLVQTLRAQKPPYHFVTLAGPAAERGVRSVHLEGNSEEEFKRTLKALKKGEFGPKVFFPHLLPPHARAKDAERIAAFLEEAGKHAEVRAGVSPAAHRVREAAEFLPEQMRDMTAKEFRKALDDPWAHERMLRELPMIHPEYFTILEVPGNPLLRNTPFATFMEHHALGDAREGILAFLKTTGLRATLLEAGAYPRLALQLLENERVLLGTHAPYPVEAQNLFLVALRSFVRRGWSFERAILKLTAAPAAFFGIAKRGLVAEGYFADLILFTHDREVGTVLANGTIL